MKPPRGLSAGEQSAWAHLASSVTPMPGKTRPNPLPMAKALPGNGAAAPVAAPKASQPVKAAAPRRPLNQHGPAPRGGGEQPGLDSHWDRRMKAGRLVPDLTLDLHDHSLTTAYDRIMAGLDQARAMNARVVLVIAGRERPVDPADRMERRGAIRAKLLDWLAASRHGAIISAVRKAHIRHGGEGAIYLILKRPG